MPWFSEKLVNGYPSASLQSLPPAVPFYQGILDQTPADLLACCAGDLRIHDPRVGDVVGASDFVDYVTATREWLALGDAILTPGSVLHTAVRSVEEVVLDLTVGGERQELRCAVVAERDAEHRLSDIRIYHSLWPLFTNHHVSTPAIHADPEVQLPAVVRDNLEARAADDADAILETYEDGAVVQTSASGFRIFTRREELRRLDRAATVPGTKPAVTICAATDDGRTCAIEYKVTHFSRPEPDQVGVTLFERGDSGRIRSERSYLVSCGLNADQPRAFERTESLKPAFARSRSALVPRELQGLEVGCE